MIDQRLFFKAMLWSFAAAALLGVAAVLTASFDTVGRVIATACLTAAVSAALWKATLRFEGNRTATSLSQGVGLLVFLLSLLGIWDIGPGMELSQTALLVVGTSAFAAASWALNNRARWRWAGRVIGAVTVVEFLLLFFLIWTDWSPAKQRLFFSALALGCWTPAAAMALAGVDLQPRRDWRWVGVAAAIVGFLYSIFDIYTEHAMSGSDKITVVIASVTVVVVYAVLVLMAQLPSKLRPLQTIAVAFVMVTALLTDILVISETQGDSFLVRTCIASAIVASFATLALAFIAQYKYRQEKSAYLAGEVVAPGQWTTLLTACPQCGRQRHRPLGRSVCSDCGVVFDLQARSAIASSPSSAK